MKSELLTPVFIDIGNGNSVNLNSIKHVMTTDMRKFYVIIEGSYSCKERYEISKDTYFMLKKMGFGVNGKKKNKKK